MKPRALLLVFAVTAPFLFGDSPSADPLDPPTRSYLRLEAVRAAAAAEIVPAPQVRAPAHPEVGDRSATLPPPPPPAVPSGSVWDALAQCESGGRWDYDGGSGFDGGLQFHPGTWSAYRPPHYPAYAYLASREQQIAVAQRVLSGQGWGAWPACSRKLGLR